MEPISPKFLPVNSELEDLSDVPEKPVSGDKILRILDGVCSFTPIPGGGAQGNRYMHIPFGGSNNPGYRYEFNQKTWEIGNQFIFIGSDVIGTPNKIHIIAWVSNGTKPGNIQLYDYTNDNVICSWSSLASEAFTIYATTDINNIPSGASIFQIQGQTASNGGKVYISWLMVEFSGG